ncbi:LysR family transcriptional regulator [Falsochrobactrum shanghaiense]|uniref:LysR family transcriptional regulator n=1 Tax=Falsochrobactrum shanghaiense TaxID=2201899 RepID=A0A316J852_9HYPH|nr:LysR family transcriptional regulator [Falsochrobactrum shanghaiense]PWL17481.1 LysR family transcriptional regulator [Falsochrobactrum shanghaiense]
MMSSLADMEIFARVVATGSMSAAARDLALSPAVVSKRMGRLEERLGTRLLQRTTRRIALTEAGQGYYERVLEILAHIEEAEAFLARKSADARGTLRISAPTTFGRMHIAPYLVPFMRRNCDLTVNMQLSDEMVDIVGEGYDLAIRIGELPDSSLVARRLAPVRRILVAAPVYIEERGIPRRIEDLQKHICVAPHNNDPWRLEGPDGPITIRPAGPLQTNSSEVVREAVLAGLGIALRSTWDIGPDLAAGRLVHILPDYSASRHVAIHAVYPSRQFLPAKIRIFIDYLSELYGPVPYWESGDQPPL